MEHSNQTKFETLEAAFVEPRVSRTIASAKAYNEAFTTQLPTSDERSLIQRRLDAEWYGGLEDRKALVTGKLMPMNNQFLGAPITFDQLEVNTCGFHIIDFPIRLDDEQLPNPKVVFHMLTTNSALKLPTNDPDGIVNFFAHLDDVYFDFKTPSIERASAWMDLSYPKLKSTIDNRAHRIDERSENILKPLQRLRLDGEFSRDTQFARACLSQLLNNYVSFDKTVPYIFSMSGDAFLLDDDDEAIEPAVVSVTDRLATAEGLTVRQFISNERSVSKVALALTMVSPHKNDPDTRLLASIDSFTKFRSLREDYHRRL